MSTSSPVAIAPTAVDLPLLTQATKSIVKIYTLDQIAKPATKNCVYFFDLDDTTFDSQGMLGSKAWREYIREATKHDTSRNWHDELSLFIAQNYPVSTIEPTTAAFIHQLQLEGYLVFGLTARERNLWYYTPVVGVDQLTQKQLNRVGIDFTKTTVAESYRYLTTSPQCFANIHFADTDYKGEYVTKLLQTVPLLPENVIFIDDKKAHCSSVNEALIERRVNGTCYWYCATDEKAARFNSLIANIQLYYLKNERKVLSDSEAALVAQENSGKDANYYLQEILRILRS